MLDSDELARMMIEISAGWEWGDPRSEVLQTPEHEAKWKIIARQMKEIADEGGIVDIPSEFPDLTGHREKWPQPPRVADGGRVARNRHTPTTTGFSGMLRWPWERVPGQSGTRSLVAPEEFNLAFPLFKTTWGVAALQGGGLHASGHGVKMVAMG